MHSLEVGYEAELDPVAGGNGGQHVLRLAGPAHARQSDVGRYEKVNAKCPVLYILCHGLMHHSLLPNLLYF